jgi:hypothetical protein
MVNFSIFNSRSSNSTRRTDIDSPPARNNHPRPQARKGSRPTGGQLHTRCHAGPRVLSTVWSDISGSPARAKTNHEIAL